jgi:uncharacterized protein with HEPN domain
VPSRDPKPLLEDILEHIARIERYASGLDEQGFLLDDKTRDAIERNVQRISEAAVRLGAQAEELCPGIPWPDIRGIGNVLRHDYDRIDPHVIWRTVQQDLPPLQLAAMIALSRLEDSLEDGEQRSE